MLRKIPTDSRPNESHYVINAVVEQRTNRTKKPAKRRRERRINFLIDPKALSFAGSLN